MRQFLFYLALCSATLAHAATVYTRINAKPADGWDGT